MDLFSEIPSIDFLDVGCRGVLDERWRDLAPFLTYTGFDADPAECERLSNESHPYQSQRYLPYAIGAEQREMVLYRTRSPFCSSLLQPNQSWVDRLELGELLEVLGTTTVACTTLNALASEYNLKADIIKVDCQGLDIVIVQNGDSLLDTTFCIETEPAFVQNYFEESTFADNERYLRSKGFMLFDMTLHTAARKNSLSRAGKHQPLWCEALWLYDYVGQAKLPSRVQALKALQISRSLQFFDYGFELAAFFGAHGVLKKHESDVLTNSSFWTTGSSRQQRPRRTAKLIRLLPGAVQKRLRWALEEISRAAD